MSHETTGQWAATESLPLRSSATWQLLECETVSQHVAQLSPKEGADMNSLECETRVMVVPSGSVPGGAIDFSELNARHSRAQLRDFTRWAKSTEEGSHRTRDFLRSLGVVVVVGSSMLLVASFTLMIGAAMKDVPNPITGIVVGVVMAAFICLSCIRLIDIWRRDVRFGVGWRRWMRMKSFAESNKMIYVPEIISPAYGGSVFTIGKARRASDVVATSAGRYVEIGNYRFCGETGLNRSLNQCGYIRVEVDRPVPHLYLRSRRSRKFGATFARFQEFSLEGDFGKYFRLYAPGGYERDALYIFTPDLMAVLIDEAAAFDVEFVDSHIYFYSPRRFKMRDPQTYLRSIRLVDSVVGKALKQTRSYADFRSSGTQVNVQGARLSRGITVAAVVGILIVVAQVYRLLHYLFIR